MGKGLRTVRAGMMGVVLLCVPGMWAGPVATAQMTAKPPAPVLGVGVLPPEQVEKLLPQSVYFQGQSAPLQLRNAAAFRMRDGAIVWAALVDTSGYSTGVRERYQFYFVSEVAIKIGNVAVPAGAYGAGFLSDGRMILMDPGGQEVQHVSLEDGKEVRRPRPLQMLTDGEKVRLYVGRQYVVLSRH